MEHLYHCGLHRITGDIVLDDFLFDSNAVGPGFEEDSGGSGSDAPFINALSVNFNTIAVHYRPGPELHAPPAITLFPEMYGVTVASSARTAASAKGLPTIATVADSNGTLVKIYGMMGREESPGYAFRKLRQSWNAFGCALVPLFARRGIAFNGRILHKKVPLDLYDNPPFYEFSSEPLTQSVTSMFKYSTNFIAEMIFKSLSAEGSDSISHGSWERSASCIASWWKERGLPGVPVIINGSGMGDTNRVSPSQTVALLSYVWKQKSFLPDYLSALPAAGIDGTLKSRFKSSNLKGMVRAKTGSLNNYGVSTLADTSSCPTADPMRLRFSAIKPAGRSIITGSCRNGYWNRSREGIELPKFYRRLWG